MGYYYEGKLCLLKKDYQNLDEVFKKSITSIFDKPINTFDKYNDKSVYIFSFNRKKYDYFTPQLNSVEEELEDLNIPYCTAIIGEEFDDNNVKGVGELKYALDISRSINLDTVREVPLEDNLIKLLRECDEEVFWQYVSTWYNPESILDVVRGWSADDIDFKEEIEKIKTIQKELEGK